MMYLLDSNVVSESWKPEPATRVISWLETSKWYLASPVIAEIQEGAQKKGGKDLDRINRLLDALVREHSSVILPWDAETARLWGQLWHSPETKRQPQALWDSLIDAMGERYALVIATRNTGDFRHSTTFNPWTGSEYRPGQFGD